jgi:hypothetical protein
MWIAQPVTPRRFDAVDASRTEDDAYRVPPRPNAYSPAFEQWIQAAQHWQILGRPKPFIVAPRPSAQVWRKLDATPDGNVNDFLPVGYGNTGKGSWNESEAVYNEPALGNTSCSDPAVSFWTGIQNDAGTSLAQTGTQSGGAFTLHALFYETYPAKAQQYNSSTANAGQKITAQVYNAGSGAWDYYVYTGATPHVAYGNRSFNHDVALEIVEKESGYWLLNFNYIVMNGYNGLSLNPISASPYQKFPASGGYMDISSPLSGAQFTVTQHHCAGS